MTATPPQGPSRVESEVHRLRKLIQSHERAKALSGAKALLQTVPENRDVLYLVAVSQRQLGRVGEALTTLERLETLHPDFARLFQERGRCCRLLGKDADATANYQRAVKLNPVLHTSWQALAELHAAAGREEEGAAATRQLALLAQLPPPVLAASGMLAEGDIPGAEAVLRKHLASHPRDIEAMRLLAEIGSRLDVLDDAEFLLESVLTFAPDYHLARYEYGVVLHKRHKYAAALEQIGRLLAIDPAHRAYRTMYANICVGLGRHEEALRVFRELSAELPENPELHLSIAHALKTVGRQSQAIESYRTAAALRRNYGDAYWSLANLKTYRFLAQEIERMRAEEAAPGTPRVDRYHLCFALGKAFEDRAEYSEAFRYYQCGNELKKAESRYDASALERALQRQIAVCTREFMDSHRGWGCECTDPIFIVGLPRAGSTLIEQILSSHSQVEGTMELADIPRLAQRLQGRESSDVQPRYPAVLGNLTAEQVKRLGEKYLADTRVYRTGKPYFIDKMPNNFRHLGLIHLILPNAKIIDARREAMGCCFSNFKQLYASGQEFTYSLEDLGGYYRAYRELMAHWDRVLPGKILRVEYEELVADVEGNVRRILKFLGLPFEPACLEFYRTDRSVRTASSEQVRQPIFREGLDQWQNFESWLRPLRTALGAPDGREVASSAVDPLR
jgi:tetratricopeptide (TPR) repeat protein